MQQKKIPQRQCMGCRERKEKRELIRFAFRVLRLIFLSSFKKILFLLLQNIFKTLLSLLQNVKHLS